MSRLHNSYSQSSYGQTVDSRGLRSRRDEQASLSGSEDGMGYDSAKHDDTEDGADSALISQTLNADGTPKRPMNAFMIFARRRRPQVSAENQALRTGEVSKLLSKEWASMPASEKRFYQDQAKLLKDSFNSKYPDYVYRRRPNNSRRRRRSDASTRSADSDMVGDMGEDAVSPGGFDSPTDGDDHFDGDYPYSRPSHETAMYSDPSSMRYARGPVQPNAPNDVAFRHPGGNDTRLPFTAPSDRLASSMAAPLLTPRVQAPAGYGYAPSSTSVPGRDLDSQNAWNARINREQIWSGGLHQDRTATSLDLKPIGVGASGTWNSSPTSSTGSSNSPHNLFPLATPFNTNPHQPGLPSYKTTSSTPQYPSSTPYMSSNRSFDPRGTSGLGVNDSLLYPARSMSRELPPISGYSAHSISSNGQMGANQEYQWPREFFGNGRSEFELMGISSLKE